MKDEIGSDFLKKLIEKAEKTRDHGAYERVGSKIMKEFEDRKRSDPIAELKNYQDKTKEVNKARNEITRGN